MSEIEKELFKSRIRSVLVGMKEKFVAEKDFRKAYHAQFNQNINTMIDKIDAGNLYNFLRFQCQAICEIQVNFGEAWKIHLLQQDVSDSPPESKKKKHKKSNEKPKVNHPRVGIINGTTFPRLNPQGFNKGKPKQEYKPLTSLPFYNSNHKAPYRPADQLVKFRDNVAETDDEDENTMMVTHYGSLGGPVNGYPPNVDFAQLVNDGIDSFKLQEAPKVGNPFDFPALPKKEESQAQESDTDDEDDGHYFDCDEESGATQPMTQLLKTEPEPVAPSVALTVETAKATSVPFKRFEVDLDDAIFRYCFPPVVEDPEFRIPAPMLHFTAQQTTFDVHVSTVQSPHKFYFHYGDQDLFLLMNQMEKFYSQLSSDDLVMGVNSIRVGMVAAVQFDRTWHRAEFVSKPDGNGYLSVFLLDFGTKIRVHITAVCYLPLMFTRDPVKALRGSIIDIRPKYNDNKWHPTVNEAFFEMVSNQKLKATIRRYCKTDNEYEVQLCVCYNMVWYNIGAILIQRGYAAVNEVGTDCPFALPLPVPV